MTKESIEHRDKLGRPLKVGDCVAYPGYNHLDIGIIKKINPKMVKIVKVGAKYRHDGSNKYPEELCFKLKVTSSYKDKWLYFRRSITVR